ncbi:uncharacterized protein LOC123617322 [Camelus bactrianus]|uniref:Uncharacterized protein LOC123617322 n=1 Tax=Camelus bactrianus TaxID=9837 RepID=A0AC58P7A9_CAMBA
MGLRGAGRMGGGSKARPRWAGLQRERGAGPGRWRGGRGRGWPGAGAGARVRNRLETKAEQGRDSPEPSPGPARPLTAWDPVDTTALPSRELGLSDAAGCVLGLEGTWDTSVNKTKIPVLEEVTEWTSLPADPKARPGQLRAPHPPPCPWNVSSTHHSHSWSHFKDAAVKVLNVWHTAYFYIFTCRDSYQNYPVTSLLTPSKSQTNHSG